MLKSWCKRIWNTLWHYSSPVWAGVAYAGGDTAGFKLWLMLSIMDLVLTTEKQEGGRW